MDLLGSILNNMDVPPTSKADKVLKKNLKEQKEAMEKIQAKEKLKRDEFRSEVEKKVNELMKDPNQTYFKYPPMDKIERSIIHDVAEIAGITSYSFGEEDIDRHIILFKKEFAPSEEELAVIRKGEEYDPMKIKEALEEKKQKASTVKSSDTKPIKIKPKANYKEKYEHLIGKDSGKDSAKITVTNNSFGYVPSENKKDVRSIEETMNEIEQGSVKRLPTMKQGQKMIENLLVWLDYCMQ
ncbi:sperm-associated antigen 7-like [Xenia sp. Carnegie-2017]|uniref:sperm-associated antigen 7-like n=1 Tax=Xenia sp. Carnegie-2017 TaxID=2897299 RepID=UPI001F04154F|nr:sperm-associated antigen 7-like [Xenia sp. Carnegie-2017]